MQKQSEEVLKDSEYVDMKLNSGTGLANHLHKTQQQQQKRRHFEYKLCNEKGP
jgi:hypothetical protein